MGAGQAILLDQTAARAADRPGLSKLNWSTPESYHALANHVSSALNLFDYFRRFDLAGLRRAFRHHLGSSSPSGTVYAHIQKSLRDESPPSGESLPADLFLTSLRMPPDEAQFVQDCLYHLQSTGLLHSTLYNESAFQSYRQRVYASIDHDRYRTYIFPEEEQLLYALTQILRPKSVVLLGSFYGYWGLWAMPAVQEVGGIAYFVDLDPKVSALAARNLKSLGYENHAEVIVGDAVEFLRREALSFDLAVLDAEGPRWHPWKTYRGKSVYFPISEALLPRTAARFVLICHNVLLTTSFRDAATDRLLHQNRLQLSRFLELVRTEFPFGAEYSSTEGIGIYGRPQPHVSSDDQGNASKGSPGGLKRTHSLSAKGDDSPASPEAGTMKEDGATDITQTLERVNGDSIS